MTRQQFLILNLISARVWVLKSFKLEKNDSESEFHSSKRKIIKILFEILKMKKFQPKLKNPARKHEGENILTDKKSAGISKIWSRNLIQRRRTWRRPRENCSRDEKLKILELAKTTKKSKKKIIRNKNVPKQQTAPKLVSSPKVPLSPIDAAKRRMKKTLLVARLDGLNHLLTPKVPKQPKNCPIFQKRRQKLKLLSWNCLFYCLFCLIQLYLSLYIIWTFFCTFRQKLWRLARVESKFMTLRYLLKVRLEQYLWK